MRRGDGFRALDVAPSGRRILLGHCGSRTRLTVWDREGTVIWKGEIPYASRTLRLTEDDLLVAETWIARLEMEEPDF